jgi:hypothetical protein
VCLGEGFFDYYNITNNNTKVSQELFSPHQPIGVFTTIQINQQKTPKLLDLILIVNQVCPQPLVNNIGGGFLYKHFPTYI